MENSQIKKEQAFMVSLQESLKQARENGGRISRGEIARIFGSFSLDDTQLQQVESYLKAHRIVVGNGVLASTIPGSTVSPSTVSSSAVSPSTVSPSAVSSSAVSPATPFSSNENAGTLTAGRAESDAAGGNTTTQNVFLEELSKEERDFLSSYQEMLEYIPELSDSVLEAVKISAMAGEPSAQKELSEQMLGNVVDIARLYAGQGVSVEDLIAAGNEALATGVTLLGHLESPREVEGELGRRIMDSMEDMISMMLDDNAMDRELEDLANLVAEKAKELAGTLGRKVTAEELSREGEVTSDQIAEAVRLTGGMIEDLEG